MTVFGRTEVDDCIEIDDDTKVGGDTVADSDSDKSELAISVFFFALHWQFVCMRLVVVWSLFFFLFLSDQHSVLN